MSGSRSGLYTLAIAVAVIVFAAFVLYLVLPRSADATVALLTVWAVVGPLLTAIVQSYFHAQLGEQAATISAAGVTAGVAAASGQPATIQSNGTTTRIGTATAGATGA